MQTAADQQRGGRRVTRLAPSPTGALHLGNARTFLINWVLARRLGWEVRLRIDDLEGPRVKAGADVAAVEDLRWLGLDWDGPVVYQSRRGFAYSEALRTLAEAGRLYECRCTRREVEASSRGTSRDGSPLYSGRCRPRLVQDFACELANGIPRHSLRFVVGDSAVHFVDDVFGPQRFDASSDLGDFVVRKADGEFGYQLATVVDDADAGVTHVVRGQDLLASTPRQILIYEVLGLSPLVPRYAHLPLVVGTDGRKLGKRHGDTRLSQLRDEGVTAGQVRRLLATWSGFVPSDGVETTTREWLDCFDLSRLPREAVTYDDASERPVRRA